MNTTALLGAMNPSDMRIAAEMSDYQVITWMLGLTATEKHWVLYLWSQQPLNDARLSPIELTARYLFESISENLPGLGESPLAIYHLVDTNATKLGFLQPDPNGLDQAALLVAGPSPQNPLAVDIGTPVYSPATGAYTLRIHVAPAAEDKEAFRSLLKEVFFGPVQTRSESLDWVLGFMRQWATASMNEQILMDI